MTIIIIWLSKLSEWLRNCRADTFLHFLIYLFSVARIINAWSSSSLLLNQSNSTRTECEHTAMFVCCTFPTPPCIYYIHTNCVVLWTLWCLLYIASLWRCVCKCKLRPKHTIHHRVPLLWLLLLLMLWQMITLRSNDYSIMCPAENYSVPPWNAYRIGKLLIQHCIK